MKDAIEIFADSDGYAILQFHQTRVGVRPEYALGQFMSSAYHHLPHAHVEIHSITVSERTPTPDSPVYDPWMEAGARGTGEQR